MSLDRGGRFRKVGRRFPWAAANQATLPTAIPRNASRNLFARTPVCSIIVVAPRAMRMPICLATPERDVYKFLTRT